MPSSNSGLAACFLACLGIPAVAENTTLFTSLPVKPTAEQCMSAMNEGVLLGREPSGELTFWYAGTAYFVSLQPDAMECRAMRYISQASIGKNCPDVGLVAAEVMRVRHSGVPMANLLAKAESDDHRDMIELAYQLPILPRGDAYDESIKEFSATYITKCSDVSRG